MYAHVELFQKISKYLPTVTDTGSFWIDHPPQLPLEIKKLTRLPVNKKEVTSHHVKTSKVVDALY